MKLNFATGVWLTTHFPPLNVDSHMVIVGKTPEKSSKNMWGVPWLSTTRSENWSCVNRPLARAGGENGNPAPRDVATKIAEENGGTVAVPSVHGVAWMQNSV